MENPYVTRTPVKDLSGFYERKEIVDRVFGDIARKQIQSHCITGERRIGKTSLLFHIMHKEVQTRYMKKIESLILLSTDIAFFPGASPTDFFREWARDICKASGQDSPSDPGYLDFRRFIKDVTETGYRIVILIDEFESTKGNPNLDRGFFEFLRALTQNYHIAFVLFSRIPLQYLMKEEKFSGKYSSPFFNTINVSYLKFLEESEARRLIVEPAQKAGVDITDFTEFILEQGYHHPFLLQLLSSIVFTYKSSSRIDHEKVAREFQIQTEDFFTYLWDHSDSDEQEALKKLTSHGGDIAKIARDKLDRRSLLTKDKEKIFCPLFEDFIRKQI
ncbi:MAG: ATP-binding protein [Candidatus Methanofastidiosia archaeon]